MQETNQNSRVLRSKNATAQQQQQVQPGQRSAARSGAAAGARSASDSSGGDDDYEDELHHDVAALNEEDCVDLLGDIENVQPRHGGGYGLPVHQMHAAAGLSGINRDTNGSGSNNSTIQPQRSFLLLGTPSEDQQQAAQAQAQPPNNMGEAIMLEQVGWGPGCAGLGSVTAVTACCSTNRCAGTWQLVLQYLGIGVPCRHYTSVNQCYTYSNVA